MASNVITTTSYVTTTNDLLGGAYTNGENLYLRIADLKVSNLGGATCFSNATLGSNGIIGTLRIKPDLSVTASRMVIDLNLTAAEVAACSAAQQTALKLLLSATEL